MVDGAMVVHYGRSDGEIEPTLKPVAVKWLSNPV
jgi:hypothetical protein